MDNIGFMHKITENMVRVALMKTTKQNRITQQIFHNKSLACAMPAAIATTAAAAVR